MSPNNGMIPHPRRWKPKRKPTRLGRPTRLTPELVEKIVPIIEAGNYIQTACMALGVSRSSFFAWMKRGREDREEGTVTIFSDFLDDVEEAEAVAEARLLEGAKREPGGKRWLLSRRFGQRFGDQLELNVAGAMNVIVEWPEDQE